MRQSVHADYSIRVLMYLALYTENLVRIEEIAISYAISKNHLTKVVHNLVKSGFVTSIRGRNGGIKLARNAEDINIGHVISKAEEDFHIVECFNKKSNKCVITATCQLGGIFAEALVAYMDSLAKYTLADLVKNQVMMRRTLHQNKGENIAVINIAEDEL
jgi:Rrf2 family transcriptional regulator, nitric oxide-sensitive transcriptional repressor